MAGKRLIVECALVLIRRIFSHLNEFVYDFPFNFDEVFYVSIQFCDDYPPPLFKGGNCGSLMA